MPHPLTPEEKDRFFKKLRAMTLPQSAISICNHPFGAAATTSSTNYNCRRRRRCLALVLSVKQIRSGRRTVADHHLIAIAEFTNAAWKFVIFDKIAAEPAVAVVHEAVKAFENWCLKRAGVTDLVSLSACGSYKEELLPST
jgi:hypothetical protein